MSPLHFGKETLDIDNNKTIFDYADSLKIRVPTSCNRSGKCHECIVEIKRGVDELSSLSNAERFLRGSYRLACQTRVVNPNADVEFAILRRQPRILSTSIKRDVSLNPLTTVQKGMVCYKNTAIDTYRGTVYGLAIDIGTTTVVMNLVNLESGEVEHTASFENPQRFGGSDIMNRISYDGGEFKGELQQVLLSSINFEIGEISKRLNFHRRRIYEVVVVGNATMRDIFYGIDVQPIGEKPYQSITELEMQEGKRTSTALTVQASELGLRIFPRAQVYSAPLISSHVGADITAALLAIGMDEHDDVVMLVDIGTNTEVVVGNKHRLLAASCPAGPAFEGGEVTFGMPGYSGAVEAVRIVGDHANISTIDNAEPEGICGSGLVDLLAELRRAGLMNELGVYSNGSNEFTFSKEQEMSLSRADISALAQAKSANFCGQQIVMRDYGAGVDDITKLYLAGGFANYINVESAVQIGFITNIAANRVQKVGNAALEGATIMLLSDTMRREGEKLVETIEHVELETTPDFFELFVEGCLFKPMDALI